MMNLYRPLLLALLSIFSFGCSSSLHPYDEGPGMTPFEVPRNATLRVVHADPTNGLQIYVEAVMDELGFTVLSNGRLLTPVPLATMPLTVTDSLSLAAREAVVVQRLFEDQPVDYFLKYAYGGYGAGVSSFSASLIKADSGEIIWNYGVTYPLGRQTPRAMRAFESAFRRVLHRN